MKSTKRQTIDRMLIRPLRPLSVQERNNFSNTLQQLIVHPILHEYYSLLFSPLSNTDTDSGAAQLNLEYLSILDNIRSFFEENNEYIAGLTRQQETQVILNPIPENVIIEYLKDFMYTYYPNVDESLYGNTPQQFLELISQSPIIPWYIYYFYDIPTPPPTKDINIDLSAQLTLQNIYNTYLTPPPPPQSAGYRSKKKRSKKKSYKKKSYKKKRSKKKRKTKQTGGVVDFNDMQNTYNTINANPLGQEYGQETGFAAADGLHDFGDINKIVESYEKLIELDQRPDQAITRWKRRELMF